MRCIVKSLIPSFCEFQSFFKYHCKIDRTDNLDENRKGIEKPFASDPISGSCKFLIRVPSLICSKPGKIQIRLNWTGFI